jgi:hypothetical protein
MVAKWTITDAANYKTSTDRSRKEELMVNRRWMLAALAAACLTPLFRSAAEQELINTKQQTFEGAKGPVYRRVDVEVS